MVKKTKKENCCEDQSTKYPYHGAEIRHINRAIGQLEGVKKMIEERRYCTEILALLSSIRSSIKSVESNIMETYLDSCVTKAFQANNEMDKKQKISELKKIFKKSDS
jgi:DNA-binding FrmR family transcriptional regulator